MTTPMTFTISEAAERLGGPFTVDFLKNHLHEIPHLKTGAGRGRAGRIAFSEQHLMAIVDKYTVTPSNAPDPEFLSTTLECEAVTTAENGATVGVA